MSAFFYVKLALLSLITLVLVGWLLANRSKLTKFFQEVRFEMGKVTWPTQDEVINSTVLVGIVSFLLAIFCYGVDWVCAEILSSFYS